MLILILMMDVDIIDIILIRVFAVSPKKSFISDIVPQIGQRSFVRKSAGTHNLSMTFKHGWRGIVPSVGPALKPSLSPPLGTLKSVMSDSL
jgi:hypothetical protein